MKRQPILRNAVLTLLSSVFLSCGDGADPIQDGGSSDGAVTAVGQALEATVTTTLNAVADSNIRQATPTLNYGTGSTIKVTGSSLTSWEASVVKFDPAAIQAAVGNGTLQSARLELTISNASLGWGGSQLSIHRMTKAWTEGGVTWLCANDTDQGLLGRLVNNCTTQDLWGIEWWSFLARPFAESPTATIGLPFGQQGVVSADVTTDVQGVLTGTPHNGWLLTSTASLAQVWVQFSSREGNGVPRLVLAVTPGCTPRGPDTTCDGVDDDCDTRIDEAYAATMTSCGVGACARSGMRTCVNGAIGDSCHAGTPAAGDTTCDGVDDNCSGAADEGYASQSSSCGTGACARTGTLSCVSGSVQNSCVPGAPAASDVTCNGVDDNCNGSVDEGYVARSTACGTGACASTGSTSCANGQERDGCVPSAPAASDATCDGVDDNCNGSFDEDFGQQTTMCTVGGCDAQGVLACAAGQVVDSCLASPSCFRETDCADSADNDGDGHADCADADCASNANCTSPRETCGNSLDDDADGFVDCADLEDCPTSATCPAVPPSAESVAPALPATSITNVFEHVQFLFTGADPIQRGVAPGTISEDRAALISGAVMLADGRPLPGVKIEILAHPELGLTHTDAQGRFHMAVNGGETLTVNYSMPGYITAQRQIETTWQLGGSADDVVMTPRSSVTSTIDVSGASTQYQVAMAEPETDADGSRRAVVVFPPGVGAQVFDASGALVNVPSLTLRVTEVTVGPRGLQAMPAPLPPATGYTYAVDITPDEAEGVKVNGWETVLSAPVSLYVDNFLQFPTGTSVPLGYYDDDRGVWKAVDNGLVVDIVGEVDGVAQLDIDGDGQAEDASVLEGRSITEGERRVLADLYDVGKSVWRLQLPHLSFYDGNMGAGPKGTASPPPLANDHEDTTPGPESQPNYPSDCNASGNSVVDCFRQVLREEAPVAGTPYTMHYSSDRVPGRTANRMLKLPVRTAELDAMLALAPAGTCLLWSDGHTDVGPSTPAPLLLAVDPLPSGPPPYCVRSAPEQVFVNITPAGGKTISYRWASADAPAEFDWAWNGRDDFGRPVLGPVLVSIVTGYEYACQYSGGARFADFGGGLLDVRASRTYFPREDCSVALERKTTRTVEYEDYRDAGIGGWSLNVQHRAAPTNEVLYGDGTRSETTAVPILEKLGEPTKPPYDIAVAPDGTVYYLTEQGIYRKPRDTNQHELWLPVSIGGDCAGSIDRPTLCVPTSIAIAPNGEIYVGDLHWTGSSQYARVVRVRPDKTVERVAGSQRGLTLNDGPALTARFRKVNDVEVGADGSVFVLDGPGAVIHRIGPDGMLHRIAGTGTPPSAFIREAEDARTVALSLGTDSEPLLTSGSGIAIDRDGGLIIVEGGNSFSCSIRHVSLEGRLTTIRELTSCGQLFQRLKFTDALVAADGNLILPSIDWQSLWRLDRSTPTPSLERIAGVSIPSVFYEAACSPPGPYPTRLDVGSVMNAALGPDGYIYMVSECTTARDRVRQLSRIRTPRPAGKLLRATSEDAREVYEFDQGGKHVRTVSNLTEQELRHFEYDAAGRLVRIVEADGNQTNIERDANGRATAIVAPFGQRTELEQDADGFLSLVRHDPDHEPYRFEYGTGGLLTRQLDPRASEHLYEYDALGRVTLDTDPAGGFNQLDVVNTKGVLTMTRTTAQGSTTRYEWRQNADGSSRYVVTGPTGHANTRDIAIDGAATTTLVDGTTTRTVLSADFTLGMFSPLTTVTTTAPNGVVRTTKQSRSISSTPGGSTVLTETLNDNGRISTSAFDRSTRTWTTTSSEGRTQRVTLDGLARVSASSTSGTLPRTFRYDSRGRVDRIDQGLDRFEQFTFDVGSGYLASATDALSQTSSFQTDALGRVTRATGADEGVTEYAYDGEGLLTSVTPPERPEHRLGYTPVDLLGSYTAPLLGTAPTLTQYEYDLDRRPTAIVQPDGLRHTFSYHPTSGQLLTEATPGAGVTTFAYDTRDRLASATQPNAGAVTYGYNGSLVTSISVTGPHRVMDGATTIWSGQLGGQTLLTHDTAFNVKSIDVRGVGGGPNGFGVQYVRDRDDLITGATPLVSPSTVPNFTVTRSPLDGHITDTVLGVVQTTPATDANVTTPGYGELKSLTARVQGAVAFSQVYERDALGRIRQIDETIQGTSSVRQYEYDPAGRLARVRNGAGELVSEYEYDGNGARVRAHTPTQQVDLGVNMGCGAGLSQPVDAQDRLCRYGDYQYAYNANGQLAERTYLSTAQVTQYVYDGAGGLRSVIKEDRRIDYVHDALGRPVGKIVDGTLREGWLYRNALGPVAKLDSAENIAATFVYTNRINVPDYMLVRVTGRTYRLVTDHLGSVRLVVDVADGAVAQRMDYDEFGNVLVDTNPGFQPFGFAGGIYDADTGLVRFGSRDYDAVTARWTAKDPMLFGGGTMNLYEYVGGDPINRIDPTGLWSFPWSDTPGMPFDLPFGPSREEHANRNQYNRCPSHAPTMCGGNAEDDFQYDDRRWVGGKWRGAGGNECAYGSDGNLLPDPEQTFNFYPNSNTPGHGWNDWFAHYWYGGDEGYGPGQTGTY